MATETQHKTYALPGSLIPEERRVLTDFLMNNRHVPLTLDCANLTKIGALGAQVLLVANHTWNADNVKLELINVDETIKSSLRDLGLSDQILKEESQA